MYKDDEINRERIQTMLWGIYPQKSFRDYIHKRDFEILQNLGGCVDREKYLLLIGQRIELGRSLSEAKDSYEKEELKNKSKNK
jgi:hypothetical protein